MVAGGLANLADLRPGELDHLARELAAGGGDGGERESDLRERVPGRVPGNVGVAEREPLGDAVPQLPAGRPERSGRAGGAEELDDGDSLAGGAHPLQVPHELREPDRQLAAEGDRHRSLPMRAARHDRRPVLLGQRGHRVSQGNRERLDPLEHALQDEREAGVHDVLGRRPPVQVGGHLGRGPRFHLVEQRQDRVADDPRPAAKQAEVDPLDGRGRDDRLRGLGRDQSQLGLRRGQGSFDLEPALDEHRLRAELVGVFVAEDVDEWQERHPGRV